MHDPSRPGRLVFPPLDPNVYPALASPSPPPTLSPTSPTASSPNPPNPRSRSAASLPLLPSSLHDLLPDHTHPCCSNPVFVLTADGSSVYRLDPKPVAEQPPPYASFQERARAATEPASSSWLLQGAGDSAPRSPERIGQRIDSQERQYGTFSNVEEEIPAAACVGSTLRTIFCGDRSVALASSDEDRLAWGTFWEPIADPAYWRTLPHLLILNFPFGLMFWPPLLAGTLAGTALLLTLPLGAVVWWLTLLLARWAATLELRMQAVHGPMPRARVVFYRRREPLSPRSRTRLLSAAECGETEAERDTRFLANSWAMFTDHYSYAALAYFLLIKPLVVLIPTILLIACFPVCLVLAPLLPIYLRAAAAYGRAQAHVAASNL